MKRRRDSRPFSPRWWLGDAPEGDSPARWQTLLALAFVVIVALSCARYMGRM
jgi:hypothetical protein